jgi:hypothetical protein
MKPLFTYLSLSILLILLTQCKSKDPEPILVVVENTAVQPSQNPTIVPMVAIPTPPTRIGLNFPLDWDKITTMPAPPSRVPIPLPWSDQATRMFSEDIRYDFKKEDGWELIYNRFSDTVLVSGGDYFILYNKYRGILRYYMYQAYSVENIADNDMITHTLSQNGSYAASSSLLNFADQQIVDVLSNSSEVSTLEPRPIAKDAWYAFEYEMAYDPNSYQQNFNSMSLSWSFVSMQLDMFSMNGTTYPKVPFSIRQTGVKIGPWTTTSVSGVSQIVLNGTRDANAAYTVLDNQSKGVISEIVNGNSIHDLKSGILSSTNAPGNPASLFTWDAELICRVKPSMALLTSRLLSPPGIDNSQTLGGSPFYNAAMGVFNLDKRPVVIYKKIENKHLYSLNVPSVRYLFNPAVTKLADIQDITQEVIAQSATEPGMTTIAKLYKGQSLEANQPLSVVGVRVSFVVAPKNGSAKVKIVKTFKADISEI